MWTSSMHRTVGQSAKCFLAVAAGAGAGAKAASESIQDSRKYTSLQHYATLKATTLNKHLHALSLLCAAILEDCFQINSCMAPAGHELTPSSAAASVSSWRRYLSTEHASVSSWRRCLSAEHASALNVRPKQCPRTDRPLMNIFKTRHKAHTRASSILVKSSAECTAWIEADHSAPSVQLAVPFAAAHGNLNNQHNIKTNIRH